MLTDSDVTFVCKATVVNSTDEAMQVATNPYCKTVAPTNTPITESPGMI